MSDISFGTTINNGDKAVASWFNHSFNQSIISSKAAIQASLDTEYTEKKQWDIENNSTWVDIFADETNKNSSTSVIYVDLGSEGFYYLDTGGTGDYRSNNVLDYYNNIDYISVSVNGCILNLLDAFDDASISGDWTTATADSGTVTETGGYLQLFSANATASQASAYYTGVNYYQTTKRIYFYSNHYVATGVQSGTQTYTIRVTDGSTDVTLKSYAIIDEIDTNLFFEIKFNGTNDTCDLYINGVLDSAGIDLSTLTNNWYVKFDVRETASNFSLTVKVYFLSDNNLVSPSSTITPKISNDSGSSFENSLTQSSIAHNFSSSGKQIAIGWDLSRNSSEMIIIFNHGFTSFD